MDSESPSRPVFVACLQGCLRRSGESADSSLSICSAAWSSWSVQAVQLANLVGTPPSDDRPHGVFATRSPRRPNPIGLTVVELLCREGRVLRVRGIDMLDGTPILDIKPYLSNVPHELLRRGWLAEAEARSGVKA